jgi:hypothetical protein
VAKAKAAGKTKASARKVATGKVAAKTRARASAPSIARTTPKSAPKRTAAEKPKVGRPTDYDPGFHPALAEAWATAGRTDKQIAEKLGVAESTLHLWKKQHPEFSESLKRGKDGPDDLVEASLFQRATGYNYDSEKILTVSDGQGLGSHVERLATVEHCPPDVTAQIYWLNNRRPARWRNRHEVTGPDGGPVDVSLLTPNERKARIAELLKKKGAE